MAAADATERPEVTWDDLTPAQQAAVRRRVEQRYARMHTRLGLQRIVRRDGSPLGTPPAPAPRPSAGPAAETPGLLDAVPARALVPLPGRHRATNSTPAVAPAEAGPPGALLRRWREERGLRQWEAAVRAGISRGSLEALENGKRVGLPDVRIRVALALGHPDWRRELADYQAQGAAV